MAQACAAALAARAGAHAAASSSGRRGTRGGDGGGKGGRVGDAQSLARGGQPRFPVCAWRPPRVSTSGHDAPPPPDAGVPVGAYVCAEAATVQLVRAALMDTGRLKAHGVTRFDPRTWAALGFAGDGVAADAFASPRLGDADAASPDPWAVHAFAPAAGEREPDELLALVASGATRFVPNLRLGNPACYVDLGKREARDYDSSQKKTTERRANEIPYDAFRPAVSASSRLEAYAARRDAEARARALGTVRAPAWSPSERPSVAKEKGSFAPFAFSELFAGVGGFAYALRACGGVPVFAAELCPHARATYAINHGCGGGIFPFPNENDANENPHAGPEHAGPLVVGDVTDVCESVIPNHDVLTGGFPCQSFSRRGDRRGFDDPRGLLYLEICRVLRACRPSAFLLENVDGLVTMRGGETIRAVTEALASCGYGVTYAVLDAADGWAPQRRRRVFFVGFRDDKVAQGALERFAWPTVAKNTGASRPRVRSILEREEDAADPPGAAMRACEVSAYQMDRAARFFARAPEDASRERRTNAVAYVAADPDGHARTLCASYRRSSAYNAELVPPSAATRARRPRFYTAREAARLMGFPETFQPDPERAWHELGNSVVVPLVRDVAAAVLTAMRWGEAADVPARDE